MKKFFSAVFSQTLFQALPGLLLAMAVGLLVSSAALRYAEAWLALPEWLRTVNISVLRQATVYLLMAMTLFGAAHAARQPLSRFFVLLGLLFSLLLMTAGLWQGFHWDMSGNAQGRWVFLAVPFAAIWMALRFARQLFGRPTGRPMLSMNSMRSGGMSAAIFFGLMAFVLPYFTEGTSWKMVPRYFFDGLDQFTLISIPLLALASTLLNPQSRVGYLMPFAALALWYAASASIIPGKFFWACIVPASIIGSALWLSLDRHALARAPSEQRLLPDGPALQRAVCVVVLTAFVMACSQFGMFALTEAAGLAAVFATLAAIFILRHLKWRDLPAIFSQAAAQSAVWMFTGAAVLSCVMLLAQIKWPDQFAHQLMTWNITLPVFLLLLAPVVFVMARAVGPIASVLLASAFLQPVTDAWHLDQLHLGVMLLSTVVLVKLVSHDHGTPLFKRQRALLLLSGVIILLALFPALSLWLPVAVWGYAN